MIVVKTRLKNMPRTCKTCPISYINPWDERCCGVTHRECPVEITTKGRYGYGKPGWCPLRILKDGE